MTNSKFSTKQITINGEEITVYRTTNDVNGNPRYIVHFYVLGIKLEDYAKIKIAARKYHNKSFGGGYVFQSYNVEKDLTHLIEQVKEYYKETCLNCGHKQTITPEQVVTDDLGKFVLCDVCNSSFDIKN